MKHIFLLIVLYLTCPLWAQDEIVFTPINTSNGLSDNRVRAIAQLSDGRMVFSTEGLINIYDGTGFQTFTKSAFIFSISFLSTSSSFA